MPDKKPWFEFMEQVAREYSLAGASTVLDQILDGTNVDILVTQRLPDGQEFVSAVECKAYNRKIAVKHVQKFIPEILSLRSLGKIDSGVMVSLEGFSSDSQTLALEARITLLTLDDLRYRNSQMKQYVEDFVNDRRRLNHIAGDEFIPLSGRLLSGAPVPDLIAHLYEWLEGPDSSLVMLGDGGAGKTTIAERFAFEVGEKFLANASSRIPLYINLKESAPSSRVSDIIYSALDRQGIRMPQPRIAKLIADGKFCVILDGIDELEIGSIQGRLIREFVDLDKLLTAEAKILVTCRLGSFQSHQELLESEFATSVLKLAADRTGELVLQIDPLDEVAIEKHIRANTSITSLYPEELPSVLFDLCRRPLHLKMVMRSLDDSITKTQIEQLTVRSFLYELFVDRSLHWDIGTQGAVVRDVLVRRKIYEALAAEMLNSGAKCADDALVTAALRRAGKEDLVSSSAIRDILRGTLMTGSSTGRVWGHKTFGEYLAACYILGLIQAKTTGFDFIWFTRAERAFVSEMIRDSECRTLSEWLSGSDYVAKQFAAFIFGALSCDAAILRELRHSALWCDDTLTRINCINTLGFLRDGEALGDLLAIVAGYLEFKGVEYPLPDACRQTAEYSGDRMRVLSGQHGSQMVVLHVREALEALSFVGTPEILPFLHSALMDDDPGFVSEVKATVLRLSGGLHSGIPQ